MLPRKQTGIDRSDETLRAVAFQIGTLVAIERNRRRLTRDPPMRFGLVDFVRR